MVDKTRQTPQTEVDKMEEMPITRDLAELVQALHAEADQCELLGITKPAAMLREAAAVIQVDANSDAMDMFAEVTSVGHLADLVDSLRMSLHHQADEWESHEELNGPATAAALRQIAGDYKPHPKLPPLPSKELQADRVRRIEENGPYPGMSVAFERHIGDDQAWTDPHQAGDASLWAAAWKVATKAATDIARERYAGLCEQTDEDGEGPDGWGWHAKDYARAIRGA